MDYKSIPIKNAPNLIHGENFIPRGSTALLDAIGKTIEELETERDVIFVIITDGDENTSREYTKEAVNKMIDTLTKEEGWKFLFLAANQDTIAAGGSIGISASNSMTYAATTAGAQNSWTAFSANTSYYRSVKNMAVNTVGTDSMDLGTLSSNIGFSDTQRNDSI